MLTFSRRIYNTFNFYSEVEGSDNTFRWFLVVAGFRLGHHHLAELIKVHGSGAVLVQFLNDSFQLLVCQRGEQLSNQAPERLGGDESLALLVVHPEGVLQLLLHCLHVGVLDQEGGAQLAELTKLNLAGTVLVDLMEELSQLLLRWPEAHCPHDVAEVVSGEELLLLRVKQVKADLQTLDLIVVKIGLLIDLLKVNVSVGISLASHDSCRVR